MAAKNPPLEIKRPLTRVREGVVLEPGESLKYTKEDGYFASKPPETRVGTEKGRATTKKYAKGGSVRGTGAATRGKKFSGTF